MIREAMEALILLLREVRVNKHPVQVKFSPGDPFTELEKLPGIVIEGPRMQELKILDQSRHKRFEKNMDTLSFKKYRGFKHYDLDCKIAVIAEKEVELLEMIRQLISLIAQRVDLTVGNEKERFSCLLSWVQDFDGSGSRTLSAIKEAVATLRIEAVPFRITDDFEEGKLITKIILDIELKEDLKDGDKG